MQTLLLAKDGPLFGINERGIILFGFEIYFYAICIVTGMLLAAYLSSLLMRRRNINPELILTLFIVCIPSALICARLYYCITDGMAISQWFDWDSIRKGGLSILGGVMGGVLAGLVVCLIKKIEFLRVADCGSSSMPSCRIRPAGRSRGYARYRRSDPCQGPSPSPSRRV